MAAGIFLLTPFRYRFFSQSGPQTPLWADMLLLGCLGNLLFFLWQWNRRSREREVEQHRTQNDIYNKIFLNLPEYLGVIDRDYRIQISNWHGGYGYVPEEKRRGNPLCYEVYYPGQEAPCEICHVRDVFASGEPLTRVKFNPKIGHVEIRAFPIFDDRGKVCQVAEQIRDISPRIKAEKALRDSEKKLQAILHSIPAPIRVVDRDQNITWTNRAARDLFGEDLLGQDCCALYQQHNRKFQSASCPTVSALKDGRPHDSILKIRPADGEMLYFKSSAHVIEWDEEQQPAAVLEVHWDITPIKRSEEKLFRQANYDGLTGLPNRTLILDRLRQAIDRKQRSPKMLAVLLLDLDKFKTVNDSLGHGGGNRLLQETAVRLSSVLRAPDTVGRLYGDEFVVVLDELQDVEDVTRVVKSLEGAFEKPFFLGGSRYLQSFSMGIALFPHDGDRPEELIKKADTAMYNVKQSGRKGFCFFHPDMDERIHRRLELEKRLQHSVLEKDFHLHYQPRIESSTGRIVGLETLLRWSPENFRPVGPDEFVPILEDTGWIKEVGEWVLKTACLTAKAWQDRGLPAVRIWVNLSGQQLVKKDLFHRVEQILSDTGLDPRHLGLELTESVLMQDIEEHFAQMLHLKKLGVRISLDDFGTGYSSLSYLKRLPIDEIKVDRSFVDGLLVDENDTAIVRTILAMARSLGMRSVGEGVETLSQYQFLLGQQCDEMQGYLFAKPLSPQAVTTLLAASEQRIKPRAVKKTGIAREETPERYGASAGKTL